MYPVCACGLFRSTETERECEETIRAGDIVAVDEGSRAADLCQGLEAALLSYLLFWCILERDTQDMVMAVPQAQVA